MLSLLFMTMFVRADLSELKWKKRVIVLLAEANDPHFLEQRGRLEKEAGALRERDLVVVEETSPGPLHARYDLKSGFVAILIGKDGGEKWRSTRPFEPREVFALIDTMPMRAREVREKK